MPAFCHRITPSVGARDDFPPKGSPRVTWSLGNMIARESNFPSVAPPLVQSASHLRLGTPINGESLSGGAILDWQQCVYRAPWAWQTWTLLFLEDFLLVILKRRQGCEKTRGFPQTASVERIFRLTFLTLRVQGNRPLSRDQTYKLTQP